MVGAPLPFPQTLTVVGLGYIGLPTSAALAAAGRRVFGVDRNDRIVRALAQGDITIIEPGLAEAVTAAVRSGLLTAHRDMQPADAFLIAVPTPFRDDFEPDLEYVESAARAIAPALRPGNVVILESTSPPGTTLSVSRWLAEERPDLRFPHEYAAADVRVAHCPERVLPGRTMIEIRTNNRVVGGITPECAQQAAKVYELFCTGEIVLTDATSAEMAKLAENAFRDCNIAFANELANVCESLGLDAWEVIRLANKHPRVSILKPGPGVGGHCIAVDPWFIVASARSITPLIQAARAVNDGRPEAVVDQVLSAIATVPGSVPATGRVAVLGLAFKADIDDLRESPAMDIALALARSSTVTELLVVEPHIQELPAALAETGRAQLLPLTAALEQADVIALLVDHSAFAYVRAEQVGSRPVIDTRGQWLWARRSAGFVGGIQ